ncbi:MAG: glycoside hydrolase family 9 protein [Marinagarivorans sp.]|nr:glycoside hydrolase family 9 protein [Marinagarivorans sp.]
MFLTSPDLLGPDKTLRPLVYSLDFSQGDRFYQRTTITAPTNFTLTQGKPPRLGAIAWLHLVADGVNTPTFSFATEIGNNGNWDNAAGTLNIVQITYSGVSYFYSITQALNIDTVAPAATILSVDIPSVEADTVAPAATIVSVDIPGVAAPPAGPTIDDIAAYTLLTTNPDGTSTARLEFPNATNKVQNGWLLQFEAPIEIVSVSNNVRYIAADLPVDPPNVHQIRPKPGFLNLAANGTVSFEFTFTGTSVVPTRRIFQGIRLFDPDPVPINPVVIDHAKGLQLSFLFFNANRSGPVSDWPDNRIAWRGDAFATRDVSIEGRKLHGYFDAGDRIMFNMPLAVCMLNLAWGALEFAPGYNAAGQMPHLKTAVRWGLRYFLNCHITEPDGNGGQRTAKFYGQVSHGTDDHPYQGPMDAYPLTVAREQQFLFRGNAATAEGGGSDLAADTAAALAAGSMLFATDDPTFAQQCLDNARILFAFAEEYRKPYDETIVSFPFHRSGAATTDNPLGDSDEMCMAAIWLYKATSEAGFLTKAVQYFPGRGPWYNKNELATACSVLLANIIPTTPTYRENAEVWFRRLVQAPNATSQSQVTFSSEGFAILGDWGALAFSSAMSFLMEIFTKNCRTAGRTYDSAYDIFPKSQMDIIMGNNSRKFSYVVGYSPIPGTTRWPKSPHHKNARARWEWSSYLPNIHTVWGMLVGGPRDTNFTYQDLAQVFEEGEGAMNYQGGYTGLQAALNERFQGTPYTNAELNQLPGVIVN